MEEGRKVRNGRLEGMKRKEGSGRKMVKEGMGETKKRI